MLDEPGQPLRRTWQLQHLEPQARPRQRAAVGAQRLAVARGELLDDVGDHAVVGRRRRAEHGGVRRQGVQHVLHAPVVGTEVVAPVGDAVRLVDHQQPYGGREQRQHRLTELRVVQALRADQQQVDRVRSQLLADRVPLLAVGAVDRVSPQSQPLRGVDLVAHQCEQRADDQRRSGTGLAQQCCRDEVHGRFAPAGALHAEHAGAVDGEVADRVQLPVAERPRSRRRSAIAAARVPSARRLRSSAGSAHLSAASRSRQRSSTFSQPTLSRINPAGMCSWPGWALRRSIEVSTPPRLVACRIRRVARQARSAAVASASSKLTIVPKPG